MPPLALPTRRYSVLLSGVDLDLDLDGRTWHTVTASSLSEALRGLRSGGLLEAAQVAQDAASTCIRAIECQGFTAH